MDTTELQQNLKDRNPSSQDPQRLLDRFEKRRQFYAPRNLVLDARRTLFDGEHWPKLKEGETAPPYQLTFNFLRHCVLSYVATLCEAPYPSVPVPVDGEMKVKAENREKLLLCLWPDLMQAWYDVELNSAKKSYGVLRIVWAPEENSMLDGKYVASPFRFASVKPEHFYPIFRSYNDPNDFMEVFRFDPGRLTADLEEVYGISLAATASNELGAEYVAVGTEPTCDVVEWWSKDKYALIAKTNVQYVPTGRPNARVKIREMPIFLQEPTYHGYSRIPFWLVQNIRDDGDIDPTSGAMGDMDDIIGLNRHFNHILSEAAVEIVTNIHRPLVYQSVDHQQDPNALALRPGAIYPIGDEEELKPIPWDGTPPMVQQHIDTIYKSIQDMSWLGAAGFGEMPSGTSGIAARIALSPFEQVLQLKLPQRKATLASVAEFLLRETEKNLQPATLLTAEIPTSPAFIGWLGDQYNRYSEVLLKASDIKGNYFVVVDYKNLMPRDETAYQQNEVYKYTSGAQSLLTTLDKLGFDDAQAEVDRIKKENQDTILNPDKVTAQLNAKMLAMQTQQPAPTPPPKAGPPSGGGGVPPEGAIPGMEGGMGAQAAPMEEAMQGMPGEALPPNVPTQEAAPRQPMEGGMGPGKLAPFLPRPRKGKR